MKKPNITPGTWGVWPAENGVVVTDDKLARHIAHIRMATPEWQADARAIAALPVLLDALELTLEAIPTVVTKSDGQGRREYLHDHVRNALISAGYEF